jgi:hypothetical protein
MFSSRFETVPPEQKPEVLTLEAVYSVTERLFNWMQGKSYIYSVIYEFAVKAVKRK